MKPGIDCVGITVVSICHDGKGNFLYVRGTSQTRSDPSRWEYGGGKFEFGETPREGVLRELREEVGCEGVINECLEPYSFIHNNDGEKSHWLIIPYIIQVDATKVYNNEPKSLSQIGWFPFSQPPEPFFKGARHIYTTYYEQLKKYA